MSLLFNCADPVERAEGLDDGRRLDPPRRAGRHAGRRLVRAGRGRLPAGRGGRAGGHQGSRPGPADPGHGRLLGWPRRADADRPAGRAGAGGGVLARRADPGHRARAVAGLGPRRRPRHGVHPDADAPGRAGAAGPQRSARRLRRQHDRQAGAADRLRRPGAARLRGRRSTSTAACASTRRPPRSSTSAGPCRPCCGRARCRCGSCRRSCPSSWKAAVASRRRNLGRWATPRTSCASAPRTSAALRPPSCCCARGCEPDSAPPPTPRWWSRAPAPGRPRTARSSRARSARCVGPASTRPSSPRPARPG